MKIVGYASENGTYATITSSRYAVCRCRQCYGEDFTDSSIAVKVACPLKILRS
jgi:hypothetical protein